MSDEKGPPQLLALLKKSQAFAESLLAENEHLRLKLAGTEERLKSAESERDRLRQRIEEVQLASSENTEHFQAIDEELNTLANLHVATWQLHSTMRLREVVATMIEICVNLVGAQDAVAYMHDESRGSLMAVTERPDDAPAEIPLGSGTIGEAVTKGSVFVGEKESDPRVVVPLRFDNRAIGAIVIFSFLAQKGELTDLDRQLFEVMCGQGATALFGAFLAGASEAKLLLDDIRAQLGS